MLAAFLIPLLVMASVFALSRTNPPTITLPIINDAMHLTPLWHDIPTAFRNQHRLLIAGLPIALILSLLGMIVHPKHSRIIAVWISISCLLVAIAANGLDCSWIFRTDPDTICKQVMIRSGLWTMIGLLFTWMLTRNKNT